MPQQQEENRGYVFIRSRRTRQIDIRRANQISPRRGAYVKTLEPALHYIGSNREQICRCNIPTRHGEKVFSVASESIHLDASLALYMTRHNIESCTAKEFQKYSQGREIEWAKEGVFVNSFHYGSREKNVVCRCAEPDDHEFGTPRNPEIIEQCAEYFCSHKERTSVSKKEWRRVNGDTPPPYGPGVPDGCKKPKGRKTEMLHDSDDERLAPSISKREMKMRGNAVLFTPPCETSHKHGTATQQAPEMPPQVWQKARPSLWVRRGGVSSTATTPLGSPSSPSGPSRIPASAPLVNCHPASTVGRTDSVSTSWSQLQRDANVDETRGGIKTAPIGKFSRPRSDPFRYTCYLSTDMHDRGELSNKSDALNTANETDELAGHRPSTNERPLQPPNLLDGFRLEAVSYNPRAKRTAYKEVAQKSIAFNVPVAELPPQSPTAELPGDIPRRQHTPTLKRLEGRDRDANSEKQSRAEKSMGQFETMSNRRSYLTQNSDLFNSLIEQIQCSLTSSMSDGEILPTTLMSTPPVTEPGKEYRECQEPSEGTNPTFASKETLADSINAQREAIFGSQIAPLKDEVRIEFPQRSDAVICTSEEDVLVAQLLLINDHIHMHAMEAIHFFKTEGTEPDWHGDVVQPAVLLLRGWNRSFADLISYMHEAFLDLMAWAELLRLMKNAEVAEGRGQGGDVMVSWVEELQDRFTEAKELYDKAKERWRIDIFEPLSCDKVALHVVARAMGHIL